MKSKFHPLILILALLCGCVNVRQTEQTEAIPLGMVDRSMFSQPQYSQFKTAYDTAQVNRTMVEMIRGTRQDVDWIVFFGTWCEDSRRQVPLFLKIADSAGIPAKRITLYALNRSMNGRDGLSRPYGIRAVPTFICRRSGGEIGRITEKPEISMEADMLVILSSTR